MQLEFTVPGVPVAQPRAQAATRGGFTTIYTPTKTTTGKSNGIAEFKAQVVLQATMAAGKGWRLLEGPLSVYLEFVFPRQKAKTKKRGDNPRYWKTTKSDIDNLCKSACDALNQIVWVDDAQVCELVARKVCCAADEAPHVIVRITTLA